MPASTQVYISGRITDCGPESLGGDGSIGFFQRALEKRGYHVFSQETALSVSRSTALNACEAAISSCQCFVILLTPDVGKTSRNLKELQQAFRDGKVIIPIWHSGKEYPPEGTAGLLKDPKLPAVSKPLIEDGSFEETVEELVIRIQMKGCYPSKMASSHGHQDSLLASELALKLSATPILHPSNSANIGSPRMQSLNSGGMNVQGSSTSLSAQRPPMMRMNSTQLNVGTTPLSHHRSDSQQLLHRGSSSLSDQHSDDGGGRAAPASVSCSAPAIGNGDWHVFLSHYQANAGNTVFSLKLILEQACQGLKCWYDNDQDPSEAGMRNGVGNSKCYLLYLTVGALTRPAVQYEARTALSLDKPIILVKETDQRFGAAANFDDYIAEAPEDLRALFSKATAIPWFRDKEFRDVSTKKILRAIGLPAGE